MASFSDNAQDAALDYVRTNAARMDICSSEPTTYAEATSTYTLGNTTTVSVGVNGDAAGGGRQADTAAISDGTVTGTGTAAFFALTDGVGELLYTAALSATQAVTSGNTWTLTSHTITIADPV